MKRTKLRLVGQSDTASIKKEIQAMLRKICLYRDKVCVLSKYPQAGACGGYRMDGELIYQAEHLVSRANSATFADSNNVVLLCQRHHIFFKPQHSSLYWELIRKHLGEIRWKHFIFNRDNHMPVKVDWKLQRLVVEHELKYYEGEQRSF